MTRPDESGSVSQGWQPEAAPVSPAWQPEAAPAWQPEAAPAWQPEAAPVSPARQPEPVVGREESARDISTRRWPNGQPPALIWTTPPVPAASRTADPPARPAEPASSWFDEPVAPSPVRTAPAAVPAMVVDAVTVGYGRDRPVLREVSASVEPGRILAVTGPSGAGKTTLLWTMAGLLRPVRGSVVIGGTPLRDRDHALAARVVLIPQDNALAAILTAQENVQVALIANGAPALDARRRTAESLERLGLTGQADQLVEELSGGQQQRTAVARGLALRAEVLLADEVTSELDAANRQRVLELLREEARRGAAVVFATHDPEAAKACDAELHLVDGVAQLRS